MRLIFAQLILTVFLYVTSLPQLSAQTSAVQTANTPTEGPFVNMAGVTNDATIGWSFTVGAFNIVVSHLGLYDAGSNGFLTAHEVAIWTSTGTLMTPVTAIPIGTGATVVTGGYRYVAITPVTLFAGVTYVIGAYFPAVPLIIPSPPPEQQGDNIIYFSSQTFAPQITYGQSRQTALTSTTDPLTYPSNDATVSQGIFGPNFQFELQCPTITVTNPAVTTGTVGTAFSQTFTSTGGAPTVTYSTVSALPTGLTLSSGGVLSGTPTQYGNFSIVVTATDANGCTGVGATYNLVIDCITNPIVSTNANSGTGSLREAVLYACPGSTITFNMDPGFVTSPISLSGGQIIINKNLIIQGPVGNTLTVENTAPQSTTSRVFFVQSGVTTTISRLTISGGNVNGLGGGILNSGGTLTVTNSTISGNGVSGSGGGIYNTNGTVTVTNSTISGNGVSGNGGGILNTTSGSTLTVTNSTISGNSSSNLGGGILNTSGTVYSKNTIIAGNTAASGPDFFGTLTSQGYNLIGNPVGMGLIDGGGGTTDILNPAGGAMLGPLANNGGPTMTHALLPNSPAIDKGAAADYPGTMTPITTDQRGSIRPFDIGSIPPASGGNNSDIGAFELQCTAPTFTNCPQNITVNNTPGSCSAMVTYTATATGTPSPVITYSLVYGQTIESGSGDGSGSAFFVGETTVTLTATNGCGAPATCSFTVTVVDNEPPSLTVPTDITLQCSDPLPLKPLNINSSPNNLDGTYIFGRAVFGPPLTTTPVTGDLVLVNDGTAPTANACEPIINNLAGKIAVIDRGLCFFTDKVYKAQNQGAIAVIIVNNQPGDVVGGMGVPAVPPPVITIPSIMVSNNYGNALKAAMLLGTVNVSLSASPVVATDQCGGVNLTYTEVVTPGNCPGNYSILKTWTATDFSGNSSSASQTITIVDNTPPSITVPANVSLECSDADPQITNRLRVNSPSGIAGNYLTGYAVFGPQVTSAAITGNLQLADDGVGNPSDACEPIINNLTGKIAVLDRGGCSPPAVLFTNKVLKAQNAGAIAVIIVNNTGTDALAIMGGIDPLITIPSVSVSKNTGDALKAALLLGEVNVTLSDPRIVVSDNCDPSPVVTFSRSSIPGTCPASFTIINTWTATDACGNATSSSQTITVVDNTPPVITFCPPGSDLGYNPASFPVPGAATATDNCSIPDITSVLGDPVNTSGCNWTRTRTYTATDACGNTITCTQVFTYKIDNTPPNITVTTSKATLWPPNHTMRDITVNISSTDNCSGSNSICTVTSVESNEPINGTGDGDTAPDWEIIDATHIKLRAERAGNGNGRVYTIYVTCTDAAGNSSTKSTQVIVAHNITAPVSGNSVKMGSTVNFAGTFWDKSGNSHTGKWLIDGSTSINATITEPSGNQNGKSTGSYKFNAAGVYKLQMNITDQTGVTSYANTNGDVDAIVVIYDPKGGYTYGGGWYPSQAGALVSNPSATGKANYGFTVNYTNATNPKGESQFEFKVGNFEFNALNFDYLSLQGAKAQFRGTGKTRINGVDQGGIGFIMTVIDGALDGTGVDKVRMKIFNKTTNAVYYDNMPGANDAANPVTPVGTNSTVVIRGIQSNGTTTKTTTEVVPEEVKIKGLDVSAYPNPTSSGFSIQVSAENKKERITLQVTDISGRVLEARENIIPGSSVRIGDGYKPGSYFVRVIQGKHHKEVKLIKLLD